jgi:hypothetical protein
MPVNYFLVISQTAELFRTSNSAIVDMATAAVTGYNIATKQRIILTLC